MQAFLVVGIDLQGLFVGFDGLIELVITERVNRRARSILPSSCPSFI